MEEQFDFKSPVILIKVILEWSYHDFICLEGKLTNHKKNPGVNQEIFAKCKNFLVGPGTLGMKVTKRK